jgi:hypothetical protein
VQGRHLDALLERHRRAPDGADDVPRDPAAGDGRAFATIDGLKDAHHGRPPYFWTIITHPEARTHSLEEGASRVPRVLTLAVVMDAIYQLMVFRAIYLVELVVVVLILAFVPYLLLRGPVNRIARHWMTRRSYTR